MAERTQGNPFFIEEIARALRERDLAWTARPPLPMTIQGALLARLDTLPLEERYVLQVASAIGPLFRTCACLPVLQASRSRWSVRSGSSPPVACCGRPAKIDQPSLIA